MQLGLLFVKEEMDTQHWEVSALGGAPGSWQNQAELGNFLLASDAWQEGLCQEGFFLHCLQLSTQRPTPSGSLSGES